MEIRRFKHPRTYHLPWSPGISSDDKVLETTNQFFNREIIITEKRDGECTSLYSDGYVHARSIDSHSSLWQTHIKNDWRQKAYLLPKGWRFVGENLYAEHSIPYDNLDSFFEVFALVDQYNTICSWEETKKYCQLLEMTLVPVQYQGIWDKRQMLKFHESLNLEKQEGYVVRIQDEFHYLNYSELVGKWVRKDHVQTDNHWKTSIITKNKLVSKY